ncbi:hypothetical protein RJ639_009664 [Escallonia herrerae]|uniref:AAA+ ATPase domain-containing protein n=1 Tax=Escallonia herrerae TaxID=1293975 RepID=A0AA89AQJ7_9ASTE|nr:hypothetical protein RJ639_009664 [Escallonia herrerae]
MDALHFMVSSNILEDPYLGANRGDLHILLSIRGDAAFHRWKKLDTLQYKEVPYSELLKGIKNGTVRRVQFEEGEGSSSRVLFSVAPSSRSVRDALLGFLNWCRSSRNVVGSNGDNASMLQKMFGSAFKRMTKSNQEWHYSTRTLEQYNNGLQKLMEDYGVTYGSAPPSVFITAWNSLLELMSVLIPMAIGAWVSAHFVGKIVSGGKKNTARRFEDKPMVKFEDVEGVDAAKTELMEIVSCLKGDTRYKKVGAKVPRGVLLSGPPGTGKTLLARAMAGEVGVPFFSLLTEMDGFEVDKKMVVVIAATNRPEALDPALCRPGRFSRKVAVGEPDEQGRSKILAVHMRGVPLAEDKTRICNDVASITQGLVGADLANIVNEAVLLAARRGGDSVSREDLISAVGRTKTKDGQLTYYI